jgi:hypothetical protein
VDVGGLALSPDQGSLYAATANGVFERRLGSGRWVNISGNLCTMGLRAVAVDPSGSTLFVGGHGVYRSVNGGKTWGLVVGGLRNWRVQALTVTGSALAYVVHVGTDGGGEFELAGP